MSMFDASHLPDDVLALLHESDQAARAKRWAKLRETFPKDLPLHVRMALLKAWLDESTDSDGEVIVSLLRSGEPPPTLVWLIPDHQTALECLSSLRTEAPDKACTLVRVALRLVQPAAAFFYTGARASGYPMAVLKKIAEQRKVAFGVDIQRTADELNIYVPVHLRIQWVEAMNLPWERFGLRPPASASSVGTKSGSKSVEDVTSSSKPETAPSAPGSPSPLPAEKRKTERRGGKTLVFYASLMDGVPDLDLFEMAELTETDEAHYRLWGKTNWKDLLSECDGVDVEDDEELDEVPCYSDITYKVTIVDRTAFSRSLREAILSIVSED